MVKEENEWQLPNSSNELKLTTAPTKQILPQFIYLLKRKVEGDYERETVEKP